MAYDLFLGKIKRNIARSSEDSIPVADEVTIKFTPEEQTKLMQISALTLAADAGDKTAKKKLALMAKKIAKLKAQSRKGDPQAKRALLVLRESGVFNPRQTLTLGWSLFKQEDPATRAVRLEKFAKDVSSVSKPEDIAKLSEQATYDQALKNKLGELARAGNKNALRVAAYKKDSSAVVGGSDNRAETIRQEIQRLRQKSPKTEAENNRLEQLTERLTRLEAMSGIGYSPRHSRKMARRLARLKARAASGDQQAIARLQQMQQRLSARAATGDQQAAALLQQVQLPSATTPSSTPPYAPPPLPGTSTPTQYTPPPIPGSTQYPYQTPPYQPPYTPPVYPPSNTPTYYQDADGNYYPYPPQPGQPQPTVDVYQGDSLGDEEAQALARDGGATERAAFKRTSHGHCGWYGNSFVGGSNSSVVGKAIPHENYRVAVMKAAVKSAGGGQPTTKDFFKAKTAVDKVIGKSGITIYMPGAKPGRRTI